MRPLRTLRRTLGRRQGRRTVRFRLTLLVAALLLVVGTALLAITYLLVEHARTVAIASDGSGSGTHVVIIRGAVPHHHAGVDSGTGHPSSQEIHQAQQLYDQALHQRAADLHQLLTQSGIALAVMAVLAVVIGWFVAGRLLRPLRTMTTATRRISAHNLHERLAIEGPQDEVKDLADTIDDLLGRLEGAFDAQRHFVANASHELRTPITLDRALLEVALANPHATAASLRATCRELLDSSRDKERLIDALLALASSERGLDHRERLDLAAICHDQLLRPDLDTGRTGLQVTAIVQAAPLDGEPRLIEHLVANLLDNAVRHNRPGGNLDVITSVEQGSAVLDVTNTGPVVPPDQLDRLFQPFQRLDPARTHHEHGHGLGLGLSIVRAIAEAHGAAIGATALPTGGLTVRVTFPPPVDRPEGPLPPGTSAATAGPPRAGALTLGCRASGPSSHRRSADEHVGRSG